MLIKTKFFFHSADYIPHTTSSDLSEDSRESRIKISSPNGRHCERRKRRQKKVGFIRTFRIDIHDFFNELVVKNLHQKSICCCFLAQIM